MLLFQLTEQCLLFMITGLMVICVRYVFARFCVDLVDFYTSSDEIKSWFYLNFEILLNLKLFSFISLFFGKKRNFLGNLKISSSCPLSFAFTYDSMGCSNLSYYWIIAVNSKWQIPAVSFNGTYANSIMLWNS